MTLPLRPEMIAAAYEFLRATPPFKGWRLPEADEVEFHVTRSKLVTGWHRTYTSDGRHIIGVSGAKVGHTKTLLVTVAHEMVHARQAATKTDTAGVEHNGEFRRLARQVCRYHGFDPKEF